MITKCKTVKDGKTAAVDDDTDDVLKTADFSPDVVVEALAIAETELEAERKLKTGHKAGAESVSSLP